MADEKQLATYHRQLPLLEVIRDKQEDCQHTLILPVNGIIICTECNAVWIK